MRCEPADRAIILVTAKTAILSLPDEVGDRGIIPAGTVGRLLSFGRKGAGVVEVEWDVAYELGGERGVMVAEANAVWDVHRNSNIGIEWEPRVVPEDGTASSTPDAEIVEHVRRVFAYMSQVFPAPPEPEASPAPRRTVRVPDIGERVRIRDSECEGFVSSIELRERVEARESNVAVRVVFPESKLVLGLASLEPVGDDPRWIEITLPEPEEAARP